MEKDSFEELLRNKVKDAELTINRNTNKERVWNAIDKKGRSKKTIYFAVAATLFIVVTVSFFYTKDDKADTNLITRKVKEKSVTDNLPKLEIMQQKAIGKQSKTMRKATKMEQVEAPKAIDSIPAPEAINKPKEITDIVLAPKMAEVVTVDPTLAPELTVQFKRGKTG
jgi:hypothetical protein